MSHRMRGLLAVLGCYLSAHVAAEMPYQLFWKSLPEIGTENPCLCRFRLP